MFWRYLSKYYPLLVVHSDFSTGCIGRTLVIYPNSGQYRSYQKFLIHNCHPTRGQGLMLWNGSTDYIYVRLVSQVMAT